MNSIINNPFRIIGISANASVEEIQGRKATIVAYSQVGKEIDSTYDFCFLASINKGKDSIDEPFVTIEHNHDMVNHALFWFIDVHATDSRAIQYLVDGDIEKATEIWLELIDDKEVDANNYSAFNNIGTLYLLGGTDVQIQKGIAAKIALIESDYFKVLVHDIAEGAVAEGAKRPLEFFVDALFKEFSASHSLATVKHLLHNGEAETQQHLVDKYIEVPIEKIKGQLEICKTNRTKSKRFAYLNGEQLVTVSKQGFDILLALIGKENSHYNLLGDLVATELLSCSFDQFSSISDSLTEKGIGEIIFLLDAAAKYAETPMLIKEINYTIEKLHEIKSNMVND